MEENNLLKLKKIRLFMDGNNLTAEQFLDLDAKYDILGYIDDAEGILHLHGDPYILSDLNEYVEYKLRAEVGGIHQPAEDIEI